MTTDIKGTDGTGTGNVTNGRSAVLTGRAGSVKIQTVNSPGVKVVTLANVENSADYADLTARIDDPRYYAGDLIT